MIKFNFNKENAVAATLYILNKVGRIDFHKLFKILYFAEQKHLVLYGKPITGDEYIAMPDGPVPSVIYNILKSIREQSDFPLNFTDYNKIFSVEGRYFIQALMKADIDSLSESQMECLNESIDENQNLSFAQLRNKSHDIAWGNAATNYEIAFDDIAACGGANDTMLSYLKTVSENQTAKLC